MAGDSELALDLGHIFLSYSHATMHIDCGCMGSVDVFRVIGTKGRADIPYQDGSWILHPSPHWPCIRGPRVMPYMYSIHFPESLPTMKSGVEKGGDRRAVEVMGHLALLLWSSHYWGIEPASFLILPDFVVLLRTASSPRAFCSGNLMPGVCSL